MGKGRVLFGAQRSVDRPDGVLTVGLKGGGREDSREMHGEQAVDAWCGLGW